MSRLKVTTPSFYALHSHNYNFASKIYFNKLNEDDYNLNKLNQTAASKSMQLENIYYSTLINREVVLEDILNAYEFAKKKELTTFNITKIHKLITKNILPEKFRGKVRKTEYSLKDIGGITVFKGADASIAKKRHQDLMSDIKLLLNRKMRFNLCFYYASYIHLSVLQLLPYYEANGILARLMEKWFLSKKLDSRIWLMPSELHYFENQNLYFDNIKKTGKKFESINNENAFDFHLMPTKSLEPEFMKPFLA